MEDNGESESWPSMEAHFCPSEVESEGILIGRGSFGDVYFAKYRGHTVALKKCLESEDTGHREKSTLVRVKARPHPNLCSLIGWYSESCTYKGTAQTLQVLVLEYIPSTLAQAIQQFVAHEKFMPLALVATITYKVACGLAHLHSLGITHRDLKPDNILCELATGEVKIADFGSSNPGMQRDGVTYVCTRPYRAPELLLDNRHYTVAVDVWSLGCVFAELLLSKVLFQGRDSIHQLKLIVRVKGFPDRGDLESLGEGEAAARLPFKPSLSPLGLRKSAGMDWIRVLRKPAKTWTKPQLRWTTAILSEMLQWRPQQRSTSACLVHEFGNLVGRVAPEPDGPEWMTELHRELRLASNFTEDLLRRRRSLVQRANELAFEDGNASDSRTRSVSFGSGADTGSQSDSQPTSGFASASGGRSSSLYSTGGSEDLDWLEDGALSSPGSPAAAEN